MAQLVQEEEVVVQEEEEDLIVNMSSLALVSMKTFYPLHLLSNINPSQLLIDYSMMSNVDFTQMLLSVYPISECQRNLLDEYLNIEANVPFIRQLVYLISKCNYFTLQDEQWTYYYQLGLAEDLWSGRVSKKMAEINSMPCAYGRGKLLIEQRRQYFQEQLTEIGSQLQRYLRQTPAHMDIDQLLSILSDFVEHDQYHLRLEFERRRHILKFDAKDHQLVNEFYQLRPRQIETHSAKVIWKAVQEEQVLRYEIAVFMHWFSAKNSSSSSSSTVTFQDLQLEKIKGILTHVLFDKQLSSSSTTTTANAMNNATCSTIDQFIQEMALQTISVAETMIQECIERVVHEKQKILDNREKFQKPLSADVIIAAIENRQMNMVERAQYNIEHQLKSLSVNRYYPLYY